MYNIGINTGFTKCNFIRISNLSSENTILDLYNSTRHRISNILNINQNKINRFNLYHNGKILVPSQYTLKDTNFDINTTINFQIPLRGGGILGDLFSSIKQIGKFFAIIPRALIFLFSLIIWVIQFIIWLFIDFLNPFNLFTDLIGGVQKITRLIFAGIMDIIFGMIKMIFNKFFGPIFDGGLMGWDQATYKKKNRADNFKNTKSQNSKSQNSKSQNSKLKNGKNNFEDTENDEKDKDNLVDMKCHNKGQKCYRTPDGQVPFSVIVATILLPPMGVFMEFGITGWLNIVICGILTLLFYFPGLIYALILIYC